MRISLPAAPVVLVLGLTFAAGWFSSELSMSKKLQRITEERDTYASLVKAAVAMSDRALEHSLNNAETLEVCLGKLNLTPVVLTPTRRQVARDSARLAQLQQ